MGGNSYEDTEKSKILLGIGHGYKFCWMGSNGFRLSAYSKKREGYVGNPRI